MIPPRAPNASAGTGRKLEASNPATALGVKVEYNFEEGTNPIQYKPLVTPDYTIKTEMTGKITIQSLTPDSGRVSYELATALDKPEMTSKLQFNNKALAHLTQSVEPKFDMATGRISLKASIAAHADIGPYHFEVEAEGFNRLKAVFKPESISGVFQMGKGRYKFSADIAFKIEITLHPAPKNKEKMFLERNPESLSKLTVLGLIAAYIFIVIYGPKGPVPRCNGPSRIFSPASGMPFIHHIDPNDPKWLS